MRLKNEFTFVPTHNGSAVDNPCRVKCKDRKELVTKLTALKNMVAAGVVPYNGVLIQFPNFDTRQWEVVAFGHMPSNQLTNGGNNEQTRNTRIGSNRQLRLHGPRQ